MYRTIILPIVLYRCKTWSHDLRKEHRLNAFENRVLRKVFEPKKYEVRGSSRKLHNHELHNLYHSPNISWCIRSRRMRWKGHVARMGEMRNAHKILVRNPKVK
jgi:hypothetical protein